MRASRELSPEARGAARLGVLGGSFDPPHAGHLHLAHVARAARALEHVVWVPAARPPHKPGRLHASARERLEMLELLLADGTASSIWTVELGRDGPSYTVDTLRVLRAARGDSPVPFLVLGSDNLTGFPGWRGVHEVLALAEPIVVPRRGAPVDPPALGRLEPEDRARIAAGVVDAETFEASSTELRERLALGASAELEELLPKDLLEYALARGIYQGSRA